MHFWIDKRSSNLHSYGGRRNAGPGGFYNRTFGSRPNHPPPSLRASSSSTSNNHSSHSTSATNPTTNTTNGDVRPTPTPRPTAMHTSFLNYNSSANPTNGDNSSVPDQPQVQGSNSTRRHHHRLMFPNANPNFGVIHTTGPIPPPPPNHPVPENGSGNPNNVSGTGTGDPDHDFNISQQFNFHQTGYGDPVISLAHLYNLHSARMRGVPGAHRHSGYPPPAARRSRSSSSGSHGHGHGHSHNTSSRRSSSTNQQDPVLMMHQQIRMPHNWAENFQREREASIQNNSIIHANPQNNLANIITSSTNHHHQQRQSTATEISGPTRSTSSQSLNNDPAFRRTKRIGLTLCFMSFILLSTVAAKFVIEGPWLIDKAPREERTEATIYFFITELVFIMFAMALLFTGVTCLRQRTNAYLLRQFNQYIMQTTSPTSRETNHSSSDYFGDESNSHSGVEVSSGGGVVVIPSQGGGDRTFHPRLFPSLENHLMNMHISVADSSSFVMGSLSKPPPYHIALYLPVPDNGGDDNGDAGVKEDPLSSPKITNQEQADPENPIVNNHQQSTSWTSASYLNENTNSNNEHKKDSVVLEDSADETEDEDVLLDARLQRRKTLTDGEDHERERSETPPPPYPH